MYKYPAQGPITRDVMRNDAEAPYKIIIRQGSQYWLHTDPEYYPQQARYGGGCVTVVVGTGYHKGRLLRMDLQKPFTQIIKLDDGRFLIHSPNLKEFKWSIAD